MTEAPELPLHMRRNGFDPVDELARARDGEGVVRIETPFGLPAFVVCRHEDVRRVLSDPTRFSNARALLGPAGGATEVAELAGNLLVYDPPEHTRLRRILTPEFTVRRMRRLEPRIVEIVDLALDDLERTGKPADLVSRFALPVPSLVICELLGVPYSDRAEFQDRSARYVDLSLPMDDRMAARREIRDYMAGLVARARAQPGEDMLGMLIRHHGDDLSADELVGVAGMLLLAGHETTSNMLSLGTLALLQRPDQLAVFRDDPAQTEPAIEELLRWLSIVHSLPPRMTTTTVEIAGHTIPEGALVISSVPAANRDRAFIENPDTLNITRGAAAHLAFGHGVHHCLGAPLARLEMRIAFRALLLRFPDLALAEPVEQLAFRTSSLVFGMQSLQVTW